MTNLVPPDVDFEVPLDPDIYLPVELQGDDEHPDNDPFEVKRREIDHAIFSYARKTNPLTVQATKLRHLGKRPLEIAQQLGITPQQASQHTRSDAAQTLLSLYQHKANLLQGPSIELRKHTLWRIVKNNEDIDPGTAISAIKELNKMDQALTPNLLSSDNQQPTVVVIDQEKFPRGPLDGEVIDVSD